MIEKELKTIQLKFTEMEHQLSRYRAIESICPIDETADIIRKERKKQNLTLKGLSELSDISYATLIKIESGDDGIKLKTIKQVAKTLGLKLWIG